MSGRYELILQQGEPYSQAVQVSGVNMLTYTVVLAQLRKNYADVSPALVLTAVITNATATTGTITLSATDAAINVVPPGLYEWDLFLSGSGNPPLRLLDGEAIVKPRVSR